MLLWIKATSPPTWKEEMKPQISTVSETTANNFPQRKLKSASLELLYLQSFFVSWVLCCMFALTITGYPGLQVSEYPICVGPCVSISHTVALIVLA